MENVMTATAEPTGKLDASTFVVANGPEGLVCEWGSVDWPRVEEQVRRLRIGSSRRRGMGT